MKNLPDTFMGRIHDPRIQRKIVCDEIGGLLYEFLQQMRGIPYNSEQLKHMQGKVELDVLNYIRSRMDWDPRELPLIVKLDITTDGEPWMDLDGPLGMEVYVSIKEFDTPPGEYLPLPDFLTEEDIEEAETEEENSGWTYGR